MARMSDIWSDLPRRRKLHTRLRDACYAVMEAGDLTEQAVAWALGKRRADHSLFSVYDRPAKLVADAGTLVGLAHARWDGFGKPAALVAAIAEVSAAIAELPTPVEDLAADLRQAVDDVCGLAFISESEIEAGLQEVQLVSSVVMGTPHELVYRRSLFASIEVFQRRPWGNGVLEAVDRMDDARGALLEALGK